MNFQIDDKTGMVQHEDGVFFDPTGYSLTTRIQNKKSTVKLEKLFETKSAIESSRETVDDSLSSIDRTNTTSCKKDTRKTREC